MNDSGVVSRQYANADRLQIRMRLHQKYSVNRQPYGDWLAGHYCIESDMRVLEVGCGTAELWRQPDRWLPADARLVLTDFSAGMLDTARAAVPEDARISFAQADIQALPYADASFDLVIANAMLYHVPDLHRGLDEAARVLRPDGRFLCSTGSGRGVVEWLAEALGAEAAPALPFSLENGAAALAQHFGRIEKDVRQDALAVTDVDDLADYVLSMDSFALVRSRPRSELTGLLRSQLVNGVIRIPKEYGTFQCYEPAVTKIFD